jgi:hypothetical protein
MTSATSAGDAILWSDFAVKKTLESQQTTLHQAVAVSVRYFASKNIFALNCN